MLLCLISCTCSCQGLLDGCQARVEPDCGDSHFLMLSLEVKPLQFECDFRSQEFAAYGIRSKRTAFLPPLVAHGSRQVPNA